MTHTRRMDREGFVTEALRAVEAALGDEPPHAQALRIVAALKRLRSDKPVIIAALNPVDYLERVRIVARAAWREAHGNAHEGNSVTGPEADAIAGIDTPLGRLKTVTWRRVEAGVVSWRAEYYLDDTPISVREMKRAGLAQRPTTRNRQRAKT